MFRVCRYTFWKNPELSYAEHGKRIEQADELLASAAGDVLTEIEETRDEAALAQRRHIEQLRSELHQRNADRLLALLRKNKGLCKPLGE